ncbi:MAG: Uridylate kinase [Chlamydiia bacterium]|nr:Uridylate kinase [Chlamydiia bacterium]
MKPKYKRVLLKLSGEALSGEQSMGVEKKSVQHIASNIKRLHDLGIQVGIVVGGGNFFRGRMAKDFDLKRTPADHIGMLATVMNGIFLSQTLQALGIDSVVMGSSSFGGMVQQFNLKTANDYFKRGNIVFFVGGTGNPYFTTDSAAALRACEVDANILLKATKVDGIYDRDPVKHKDAKKYDTLSYEKALADGIQVMDATAIALCREVNIPIYVFNLFDEDALVKAVHNQDGGTVVS